MEIVPNANTTKIDNVGSTVYDFDEYNHWHFDKYLIKVSTLNVYNSRNSTYNRTGAHELGHVLGLADNEFCIDDVPHHHEETIMGWG